MAVEIKTENYVHPHILKYNARVRNVRNTYQTILEKVEGLHTPSPPWIGVDPTCSRHFCYTNNLCFTSNLCVIK